MQAYSQDLRERVLRALDRGDRPTEIARRFEVSRKVAGVRQAIEAAGATLLYLPPYSHDLNPIEKLFSKLKALLRKAAKRSVDELWTEIGALLNTLSPTECTNYFAS
jgi:transposase